MVKIKTISTKIQSKHCNLKFTDMKGARLACTSRRKGITGKSRALTPLRKFDNRTDQRQSDRGKESDSKQLRCRPLRDIVSSFLTDSLLDLFQGADYLVEKRNLYRQKIMKIWSFDVFEKISNLLSTCL